jgi:hypothetical protein
VNVILAIILAIAFFAALGSVIWAAGFVQGLDAAKEEREVEL